MNQYEYWLAIAERVAYKSKCLSRKIGAVIITPDGTIVGTGYNGPPRRVAHCDSEERFSWLVGQLEKSFFGNIGDFLKENGFGTTCPRYIVGFKSGEGTHLCTAGHAERNALINSAREGIKTKGCFLVCSCPLPCFECAKEIINAGIAKIICYSGPAYDNMAMWLLEQAGIEVVQIEKRKETA